jgi:hypothetical protein
MEDIIDIIVTETTNLIEITSQPTDEVIDVNIIDNREDITLNVTPSVVEININSLTGNFGVEWGDITGTLSNQTDLNTALSLKADLVDGKVPSSQLPSYVDDVVEVANYASLPATGEVGKIYITLDTNFIYRWTGSTYVEIKDSSAVWGAITGTLSNQTDLQSALNAKANDNAVVHNTGNETIAGQKTFTGEVISTIQLTSPTIKVQNSGNASLYSLLLTNSSGIRNVYLPDADGTIALTSNLHNPVTLGTANGLSLSTQVLSLGLASSSANGALSSTDWTTFNSKQAALSGTGFVKISGTTISYDNSTYLTTSAAASTYLALAGGTMTGNLLLPANNTVGGTNYYIGQTMASNDFWRIYGNTVAEDQGEMIFELGDNATPIGSNGQRFRFYYSNSSSGTVKSPLIIDYNTLTIDASATITGAITNSINTGASFIAQPSTGTNQAIAGYFNDGGQLYVGIDSSTGSGFGKGNYAYNIYGNANRPMVFSTDGTARLTIAATTGAASFSSSVTAASVIISGANATEQFRIGNTIGGTALGFTVTENSTTVINSAEGGTGRGIQFQSGGANTMIITSAGFIGINTTAPATPLEVNGVIRSSKNEIGFQTLGLGSKLEVYSASYENIAAFRSIPGDGINPYLLINTSSSGITLEVNGSSYKDFIIKTSATPRLTVTSGGNVLVGTTDVNPAGANTSGMAFQAPGLISISRDGNPCAFFNRQSSDGELIRMYRQGTQVGNISVTTVLTTYNTTSDYRLKEDLKPINGLEIINKIKVYDYKWKSTNERMDGVMAHELAEVLPYAVQGVKDGEQMQSVDYSKIVPVMVQAIKEEDAKIVSLQNKVTELEIEIQILKNK